MEIENIRDYALGLKEVTEGFPFDSDTLVFKVAGKMFLLISLESQPLRLSFKHLPEDGLSYREQYPSVIGGYHMNKKHWSTASLIGEVNPDTLKTWIQNSYDLVVASLPKYKQKELNQDD